MTTVNKEKHQFQAEVKQVLDLVIHSLYSNKDIFLRELISNASDAIDKLRFKALTEQELLSEDNELEIKIIADKEAKTLTIRDNGIGMDHDDLINNLGTIAKSGTREFINAIKESKNNDFNSELIGQFGVGFYSAFMVAKKLTVNTRKAGELETLSWTSEGAGEYEISEAKEALASSGTEIVMELNDEDLEYLEEFKIRTIVKKYSDFVEHPVKLRTEIEIPAEEETKEATTEIVFEQLNSQKAIWTRSKSELSDEDYQEFYKHISHDFMGSYLQHIHYSAEGTNEFKALLYIPEKAPFDLLMPESKRGLNLYIKRVFITNDCELLLPQYLRFIKGVIDSSDLPLNVSREVLQSNPRITAIKNSVTKKVLSELSKLMKNKPEEYSKFYAEFGKVIKEGVHIDFANKDKILDLLQYETTKTEAGKMLSLEEAANRSSEDTIYYITGESRAELENSPYLEAFKAKDIEVVFMTDTIDEWVVMSAMEYKGKKFKSITKGDLDLDKESKEELESKEKDFKSLLENIKSSLGEKIKEVKFSNRLVDTLCCLVVDEASVSPHLERIYKAANQPGVSAGPRTLELNAKHPVVDKMQKMFEADANDAKLNDYAELIYDQALLMEGSKLDDPKRFSKLLSELMV